MNRHYSIKPSTRKLTIDTLDLVSRGKWIDLEKMNPYISLNLTLETPIFTAMGWQGIATVTVDLAGLREAGETVNDADRLIIELERIYNQYSVDGVVVVDQSVEPHTDALTWFDETQPKRSRKVASVPEDAIALDERSRRYNIEFSKVLRYRNLTSKKTGEAFWCEDYYCLATDAPECVRKALNY